MNRMRYLVIHCITIPEGRGVAATGIRAWHTNPTGEGRRSWEQVGYTDLFKLDGTVGRLVQDNEDASMDPWGVTNGATGYNSVNHRIVYAGGVSRDGKAPEDTRTAAQLKAIGKYVKDFHRRFPGVKIIERNRLAAKVCPSSDVEEWL